MLEQNYQRVDSIDAIVDCSFLLKLRTCKSITGSVSGWLVDNKKFYWDCSCTFRAIYGKRK